MTTSAQVQRKSVKERLSGYKRYWDEERETLDAEQRDKVILERMHHQLRYVYEKLPFYRRHYNAHGFKPDMVRSIEDFTAKVPVITKQMLIEDQAAYPPFGSYAGVDRENLARIHGSSGTTGTPTIYSVSRRDWERAGEISTIGMWSAGVRPDDIVQISFPFTLFFGGWGLLQAAEKLGAGCFPAGSLVSSERQIELLKKFGCDVLIATPSYMAHLANVAKADGIDPETLGLAVALVAGEPGGSIPSIRTRIKESWGHDLALLDFGAGMTSEMYPFTSTMGCLEADGGVHVYQDENYLEIVSKDDPNTSVPVSTSGGVVATHLWRESQPMIRFRTGDESVLDDTPCPCGRSYPRLPKGVYGRLDDMLIVRGANIYPSTVESVIRKTAGTGGEFRIVVERPVDLDEITVEAERAADLPAAEAASLQRALEQQFKSTLGVRVTVNVVDPGTFEVQTFKARRVVDNRNL